MAWSVTTAPAPLREGPAAVAAALRSLLPLATGGKQAETDLLSRCRQAVILIAGFDARNPGALIGSGAVPDDVTTIIRKPHQPQKHS